MNTNIITKDQAMEIESRLAKLEHWVDSIRGKNGWASYRPEDKPSNIPDVSNTERSQLEIYRFVNDPPITYTLYIKEEAKLATTWTGDVLGTVIFGREYKSPGFWGWPSTRVPITIHAINGAVYHGTYYKSSGDYARIKMSREILMTKRHFIALADAIREHNESASSGRTHDLIEPFTIAQLRTLAYFCGQQNSRFNRERWLDYIAGKCGPNGGTVK